jgi:hypothetical protein
MARWRTRRSKTPTGQREAGLSREARRLIWVVGLALLATIGICVCVLLDPWLVDRHRIRTAAARSHFIFGFHGSADDFARVTPHVDEAFRAARAAGQKVLFVQENADVDGRKDPETGTRLPLERCWALIQEQPAESRAWFESELDSGTRLGELIREGRVFPDASYDVDMGEYQRAVHTDLLARRALLAGVTSERPSWETHKLLFQNQVEAVAARNAFCRGDVPATERHMKAARVLNASYDELRDLNLVLRVGQLLADRPGVRVVSIRGVAHWPMVGRYGLQGAMDSAVLTGRSWNPCRNLDMARIRGEAIPEAEERRLLLLAAPLALAFDALVDEEGLVDRDAVDRLLSGATDLQSMTAAQVEALSLEVGRLTASSANSRSAGGRVLVQLLRERGLLPPTGR